MVQSGFPTAPQLSIPGIPLGFANAAASPLQMMPIANGLPGAEQTHFQAFLTRTTSYLLIPTGHFISKQ